MSVILIRSVLAILYALDQEPRKRYAATNYKIGRLAYSVFAHCTAKLNRLVLSIILNQIGWPTLSQHGLTASTAAFCVVQHAPHAYMERYAPLMRDAVCQGDAELKHFATLQDRLLTHRGKKQIYGTQYSRKSSAEPFALWPVVKPAQLNERRQSVGMTPHETSD